MKKYLFFILFYLFCFPLTAAYASGFSPASNTDMGCTSSGDVMLYSGSSGGGYQGTSDWTCGASAGGAAYYNSSGSTLIGLKVVKGSGTLVLLSATVNLSGSATFTNSSSYTCSATDTTGSALSITAISIQKVSGSQIKFLGSLNNTFDYTCIGS